MKFLYAINGFLLIKVIWVFFLSSTVTVVRVIDGDSFIARDMVGRKLRVRLRHIDAPELGQRDKMGIRDQGKLAKLFLKKLIEGKKVSLRNQGKDFYKRTLADVYLEESYINAQLIRSGKSLIYKKPKDKYLRSLYEDALAFAKHSKKGFWYYGGITHPRTFRRKWRKKTRKTGQARYNI